MVNANRILTVSYGTFSCTLEGFDEPFSTMTSIAEYFRDLAADDRYFGAEPPTPDAEMLHRIAEREIQRRVEARVSETGIVLRQTEGAPDRANLAPAARSDAATEPASFSDKLQRIRAVAARPAQGVYAEDEHAEEFFVETPIETAFADIDEGDAIEDTPEVATEVETPAPAAVEDTPVVATEVETPTSDHVEAEVEEAPEEDAPHVEAADTPAEAPTEAHVDAATREARAYAPDDEGTFLGAAVARPVAALADVDSADNAAPAPAAGDDDAAITAVLGSLGHPPVLEETDLDTPESAEKAPHDLDKSDIGDDEDDEDLFADWDETGEDDWDEFDDEDDETPVAAKAETPAPVAADTPIQPRRPVARVIKVRRATAEEAKKPIDVPGISTLSDEDEAALAAELAEVRADDLREAATAKAADPLAVETDDEPADRIAARKDPVRTAFDDVDMSETDVAIDRILEKTNTQLKNGEATRRRSAIQHLKAAVQATRADREATGETRTDDNPRDAYLEDLARVVRPRRPGGDGASRRMAPLVLVSEQRIDEISEAPADKRRDTTSDEGRSKPATHPVRPRRVTKGNLALSPDLSVVADAVSDHPAPSGDEQDQAPLIDGFRRYLADSDAEGNEELLEAAMAFITQEVGRANVTRPQLMTLVMNVEGEIGREDALGAFATLLRQGRIEKVKRGLFVLGEASRFFDPDE
jgi:hypothetical protein